MPGNVVVHPAAHTTAFATDRSVPSPDRVPVRHVRVRNRSMEPDQVSLASDLLSVASDYSLRASRYWKAQKYNEALASYQEALDIYRRDVREPENGRDFNVIVDECNAAATLHNMGLVHKRCRGYEQAVRCFQEAEELYRNCMRDVIPLQGRPQQQPPMHRAREVCLEHMLAETLQSRAGIHSRYLEEITAAIDCHEQVISLLLGLDKTFDENETNRYIATGKFEEDDGTVVFVRMNDSQRGMMLCVSLKELGNLNAQRGHYEDALTAFEESMEILKCQNHEHPEDNDIRKKMATVFMSMAAIHFECNELEDSIRALRKSMEIRFAVDDDATHPDVLAAMNNMGIVHERRADLESALDCYENVLMLRAESLGEDHVDVAHSLRTVAAVMALQGNWVGALDLYEEALRIFRKAVADVDVSYLSHVVDVLCRMATLYLDNGEQDEAIRTYQEALKAQRALTGESHTDVAHLYHRVGQVYMEKKSYHPACQYFRQSLRLFKASGMSSIDPQYCAIRQNIETAKRLQESESLIIQSESEASDDMPLVWDASKEDYIPAMPSFPEDEQAEHSVPIDDIPDCSPIKMEASPTGKIGAPATSVERTARDSVESSHDDAVGTVHIYTNRPNMTVSDISDSHVESSAITTDRESSMFTSDHESVSDASVSSSSQGLSTVASETENDTSVEPTTARDDQASSSEPVEHGEEDEIAASNGDDPEDDHDSKVTPLPAEPSEFESEYVVFGSESRVQASCDEDDRSRLNERWQDVPDPPPEMDPSSSQEADKASVPSTPPNMTKSLLDEEISHNPSDHSEQDENSSAQSNRNTPDEHKMSEALLSKSAKVNHRKQIKSPPSVPREEHMGTPTKDSKASPHKGTKPSPRHRFTKALSKRFRRGSQSPPLDSMPEESEAVPPPPPKEEERPKPKERPAPVRFVALSSDDSVSQITFTPEDYISMRDDTYADWWWGGEGLEGWFPSKYVKKAVAVAEDFLSASSIHDKQKQREMPQSSVEQPVISENSTSADVGPTKLDSASEAAVNASNRSYGKPRDMFSESRQDSPVSGQRAVSATGTRDFDYLLGNMNVVHCEMKETDSAVPFIEVVNTDVVREDVGSKDKKGVKKLLSPRKKKNRNRKGSLRQAEDEAIDDVVAWHGEEHADSLSELVTIAKSNNTTLLEAFKIQKSELGDHEDVANSSRAIAEMHALKKDYKSALEYYIEAHRIEEALFGSDRPENAKTLNGIGMILAKIGEFDQAMENHQKALKLVTDHCGEDISNPLVAQTLICIGAVYYKERNSLSTIRSKTDGYSDFFQSGMLDKIARAHEECGSYRMAIAFFEEKLQLVKGVVGTEDQQEVAMTLKSLGTLACRTGHYLEALGYYDKALTIQQNLGCDQLQLAEARVLTAVVHFRLGQFEKSRSELQEALLMQRGTVGDIHENVAATLCHIGVVHSAVFEYAEAMKAFEEALEIQNLLLGMDHEATLQTRLEIAKLLSDQFDVDTALEHLNDILECQKRVHGNQHPNIAETLHSIGKAQVRKEKLTDALKTYEECFFMREKFLGVDHPLVAMTLHSIAAVHARNTRHEKALRILNNVLTIRKETLGEGHIDVARTLASQGSSHTALGNVSEATECYNSALPIAVKAVGKSHPILADIHVNMANLLLRKCQFDEAKNHVRTALDVYELYQLPDDHPRIVSAKTSMDRIEREELLIV